ncbi:MAG TPA: aspartate aminotransferase family protein, partial [Phycisphaerales bacterium]|nr:aspartate aminotransferase family protein [Phycisphaerales bacterium]
RDWQVPLGRRFRSLKLWFVLRHYGLQGLQSLIRHHVALAESFETMVNAHPLLELSTPRNLTLLCFHHVDGDAATEAMHHAANAGGEVYLSHTKLATDEGERYVIRMSIGQSRVEASHVTKAFEVLAAAAEAVRQPQG